MVDPFSEMEKIKAQAESELFPGHTDRSSHFLKVVTEKPHLRAYLLGADVDFQLCQPIMGPLTAHTRAMEIQKVY